MPMGSSETQFRNAPEVERPDPYVLDLAGGRFGGLAIFDPTTALLARLGAPSSRESSDRRGAWFYPRWGLKVEIDEDRIVSFVVAVDPEAAFGFSQVARELARYGGSLVLATGGLELRPEQVTEEEVRRAFGEPETEESDEDDGESYLTFAGGGRVRIFTFVQEGGARLAYAEIGLP
jgi:hypothetical protein